MRIRAYGTAVVWLDVPATPVAGAWSIGKRGDQNPALKVAGLPEWGYGLSNVAVYHAPSGRVAAWFRGRLQASAAALQASVIWNGAEFDATVPLETRNAVRKLFQDAPGRVDLQ